MITFLPAGLVHAELLSGMHTVCFADPWSADSMAATLSMPGVSGLIALSGGSLRPSLEGDGPAGMILYRLAADESEILTLGVLPPWRRQGIAGLLLEQAMAALAQSGGSEIFLEVAADNPPAIALYRGKGFAAIGRRKNYYADGDALTMHRLIGSK